MSYAYTTKDFSLGTVVGASETNTQVSLLFPVSHAGSLNILVGIKCSAVTAGAGITAKLQSSMGGTEWIDGNTVAVTTAGWVFIRMNIQNSSDQSLLPLANVARIVVTSGAGSAVTVDQVLVNQGI